MEPLVCGDVEGVGFAVHPAVVAPGFPAVAGGFGFVGWGGEVEGEVVVVCLTGGRADGLEKGWVSWGMERGRNGEGRTWCEVREGMVK